MIEDEKIRKLKSYKDDNFHYTKLAEEASELATAALQMVTKPSDEVMLNLQEEITDVYLRLAIIFLVLPEVTDEKDKYLTSRLNDKVDSIIKKYEK